MDARQDDGFREGLNPSYGLRVEMDDTPSRSGAMRSIEPGISRFRVWSFGPSRN